MRRQLIADGAERYCIALMVIEPPFYTGALYMPSGRTNVGTTRGRDGDDRHTKRDQPKQVSGSDPSEWTGGELLIGDIVPLCHRLTERNVPCIRSFRG